MFKFNKNYDDNSQVAEFYDEFKQLKNKLEAKGKYPSNSLFESKIAGIAGDDEKTAIYLLQQLDTEHRRQAKIKELQDNGYKRVQLENGGNRKYESVVKVGNDNSRAGFNEYPKAKIWFANGQMYIVPKGNRTRGYNVYLDSEVFAK